MVYHFSWLVLKIIPEAASHSTFRTVFPLCHWLSFSSVYCLLLIGRRKNARNCTCLSRLPIWYFEPRAGFCSHFRGQNCRYRASEEVGLLKEFLQLVGDFIEASINFFCIFFTKRKLKIVKTISSHLISTVFIFLQKMFISWHYPFEELNRLEFRC